MRFQIDLVQIPELLEQLLTILILKVGMRGKIDDILVNLVTLVELEVP